jgi:FkbM family methyltransferase
MVSIPSRRSSTICRSGGTGNLANLHYHCVAAGNEDGEREFYFNAADLRSSSFYRQDGDRFGTRHIDQARAVQVRRLDTLLNEGRSNVPIF